VNAAYLADSSLAAHLARAFPATLVQRFGDHVERHPLRAELMATQLANYVINRIGAFSLLELLRSSSAGTSEVVRAVLLSIEAFGAERYWASIEALDYEVDSSLQNRMMLRVIRRIREGARWFLRNRTEGESLLDDAKPFVDGLASMRSMLPALLPASSQSRYGQEIDELSGAGVPKAVATAFVEYGYLAPALSLIDSAFETQESLETVTHAYYLMGESLSLDWLASFIDDITPNSVWEAQVRTSAIEDLAWRQRMLACRMLRETKGTEAVRGRVEAWSEANSGALGRTASVLASLQTEAIPDLAMVTVAMRELKRLS
jgi:glutamate dehydrogenase